MIKSTPPDTAKAGDYGAAFALCAIVLAAATFLQKIAVPGMGGAIPITLVVVALAIIAGLMQGVFLVNVQAGVCYVLMLLSAWMSLLLSSSPEASVMSILLLAAVQAPLVLQFRPQSLSYERIVGLVRNLALFFAICAMAQFALQFWLGPQLAFWVDMNLPPGWTLKGFDFLVPLSWSSEELKSNGIFFAEPSLLSQFLAIGVVAELVSRARLLRLAILMGGLVSSYSGTGILMLAFFLPAYVMLSRRYDLLVFGALAVAALIPFSDALRLEAITARIAEFSSTQSSAFARFFSIFPTLEAFIFNDPAATLWGRGPGTVMEHFQRLPYEAFDPTWGKLVYEYGLVGTGIYACFFYYAILRVRRPATFALAFTYVFLGGYLLNAFVIAQMLVLVAWTREQPEHAGFKPEED